MEWTIEQLQFRMVDTLQNGDWWLFKGYPLYHTRYQCTCPKCGQYFLEKPSKKCRACKTTLTACDKWSEKERFGLSDALRPRIVAFEGVGYIFLKVDSDTLYDEARRLGLRPIEKIDLWHTHTRRSGRVEYLFKVEETPEQRTQRVFSTVEAVKKH